MIGVFIFPHNVWLFGQDLLYHYAKVEKEVSVSRRDNFNYLKKQIQHFHREYSYIHPYFRDGVYTSYKNLVKRNYESGELTEKQMQKLMEMLSLYSS